jgi:hypothetical protein
MDQGDRANEIRNRRPKNVERLGIDRRRHAGGHQGTHPIVGHGESTGAFATIDLIAVQRDRADERHDE